MNKNPDQISAFMLGRTSGDGGERWAPERLLHAYGLRATPQRAVVLEALTVLSHPDAEAVFAFAQARQSTMSLATVYSVLDRLRGIGLVRTLEFRGRRYFDIRADRHDHMRCRLCGRLVDVERSPNTRLVAPPGEAWLIEDQAVVWEGVCPQCRTHAS